MSWHLSVRSMSAALVVSMLVGLLLLSPALALAAPSHTPPPTASSVLTILPDGSLSNTSAPVSVHGLYYSLTAGLTGSIVIERSGAILNGTNHTVTYASGGNGFAVTVTAPYVTVEWVRAAGAPNGGVSVSGAQYVAIKNNNLAQAGSPANSILVTSGNYDSITSNSLGVTAASAVEVLGSTGFNISSNVVGTGAGYAFDIEGSTSFTVWNNAASGTGGAYFYNDMNFAVSTNNFAKGYGYSSQTGQGIVSFDNLNGNFSFNNVQNNSFALTSTGDVGGSFYANTFRYVDPSPGLGALGGINFQGDTGVLFQSNSVVNILQVYVLQSTGTTISGNTISGNSGAGIYLDTATSTAITSNTISNVPYGVEVVDASVGTSITSNVFTNNPDAIYGQGSSSFTITSNTVSASSGYPIDLINSNAVDVEMNTLGGTYYSYFYNQSGLTFMNNTVSHAGGLIAQNVWGTVIVSYNTFTSDSQFSIAAVQGSSTTVWATYNTVTGDSNPVQVFYGQTAIVSDNTISGATGAAGLFLGSNSFVIADANSVTGTASGPALVLSGTSDGAMITDNTLANSYGGISVTNSSWNMITNNSILSDTHYSFSLTQNSLHNWIYHNTFVADTNWVIDATSTANWFNATYPTGGNFWANDTGPDVHSGATVPQTTGGSDGIVDAPFSHGYVTDNYPLVNHYAVRTLTFYGTGIASSGTWGVRVTWNPLGNQNQTTTTTLMLTGPGNITFSVTAGGYQPYNYSVLPPAGANVTPRNGGGVITTTSQTIGLAFTQQTYTVTFTETGLTSGTSWSVNLSGVKHTSITATISFTEINGTYAFTVPGIAGHWRIPSSGSVTVAGAAVTKAIQWGFNPPYTVTFSVPANLPGGSWWNVSFNGLTLSTQSSTIVFTVSANGTYRYEVQAPSFTFGQIFLPLWGNATVNGASISIATPNLLFEGTLSFELQGLPSGLQYWVVVVGTNGAYYYNETITGFAPALPQHTGSATPVYANFTNAPAGGNGGAFAYTVLVGGSRTQVASGTATLSTIAPGPVMVNLASSLNQIVFMPTGLTAQSWGVTVNGATQTGAGDNPVSFTELNGTYTYSVSPPSGFHVVPSSGTLTVSGGVSTPVDLTFSPIIQPTYAVTFTESGLTSGTSWSVTFNGATQSSSTDSIVFSGIPNGSYGFTVGSVSGYLPPVPSSGVVTVDGAAVSTSIEFTPTPPPTYTVTFTEAGLPTGTSWSVTLGGSLQSSTSSTITFFDILNGTYSFAVSAVTGYTASPSSGSVTVNGAPTGQGIQFTPVPPPTYTVTFNEQGLPEGTTWSVTFNGVTQSSSTSSIAFTGITSGYYFFGVDTVAGYKAAPPSGTVVVSGADVSQTISFTVLPPFTYSVVFAETGLAAEQSWSVTLGGSTQSSTTSTITFTEINGTYAYTVGSIIGMKALPSSGSVTVRGAAVAVPIAWSPVVLPTYAITFTETGISAGTNWTLAVGRQSVTTNATTITVQLANGTYAYSISASGYQTATGTVTVIGAAQNIPVSVSQNTTTTSISWLDWVLIAIVIIVIIILLLVLYMRGGGKKPAPVVAKESTPSGTTTTTTTTNTTTDRTTTPSGSSTTTSTVKTRTTPDSETPPGQK